MSVNPNNVGARFSVIIVNYNGGAMLTDCVRSVMAEGVPSGQIIVVDNGSRDGSIETLPKDCANIHVLRNPCNAGFARAVNRGIRCASSEFFLLLNNDAQLHPGALHAFANAFENHSNMIIGGGQLHYPDGRLQSAFAPLPSLAEEILPRFLLTLFRPAKFKRKTAHQQPIQVECVLGACLCVRSSQLPALGLLDEDYFFYFEEIDWCRRASLSRGNLPGAEVWYIPAARAEHGYGATAGRFRGPSRVEYQRSKLIYFRKIRSHAAYRLVSTILLLRTLINALASSVMCIVTLFLNQRLRLRAATYLYLLCWHALLRPASWGLPDKCARAPSRE